MRISCRSTCERATVIWDAELIDYKKGYSVTVAPLVVKDKVIVGVAGAEFGIRGFIQAFDVQTGKPAWKFYTVAGPDEPAATRGRKAPMRICAGADRSG